ncbi:WD40/YVTN/BNR-like repeat-containing protein [Spirillospora sp. NPDC048911]|uniref:WD40/YVTN/BNR-like repeat-containing protein n=1 Tax=Spirillospora sp. NPDC048911 TaxID=3364527 RepID=UPI00371428F0
MTASDLSGPQGSREIRRRLTADPQRATGEGSAWQQAYEAWRTADLSWSGDYGPTKLPRQRKAKSSRPAKPAPVAAPVAEPVTAPKAVEASAPKAAAPKAAAPKAAERKAAAVKSSGVGVAEAAAARPAEPEAPAVNGAQTAAPPPVADPVVAPPAAPVRRGGARRASLRVAGAAAAVVVVAAGGVYALSGGEEEGRASAIPGAVLADRFFAADPAKPDGLVQDIAAVTAAGATVVAVGTEGDGRPEKTRAEFLVSGDAGRTWRLAQVRDGDGAEPAFGDRPRFVAGGQGAWVALGPGTVWTSQDAQTWTRQAGGPLTAKDRVDGLARTGSGFVAVGSSGGRAVVWTSADGKTWQRDDRVNVAGATAFDRVAAMGDVVVAHGAFSREVTRKKKKRKVTTTVRGLGFWRSADGGRTWKPVDIRQGQGSFGPASGLAAGPGGFFVYRDGKRVTGPKKRRKTERFGMVFGSADGSVWSPYGRVNGRITRLGGSASGLTVLAGGRLMRSADGKAWQPAGETRATANGLTVAEGGVPVVVGRRAEDSYLAVSGQAVDLTKVPGAVRPERAVTAIAPDGGMVAVGSSNYEAAVWSGAGGWTRTGLGKGRLTDVAYGPRGWVAIGRTDREKALTVTSPDGRAWAPVTVTADGALGAVASGPQGYVVVGVAGAAATAWRSSDLKTWTRSAAIAGMEGRTWMRDVVATSTGYVAVGGRQNARGGGSQPAVWTSADGAKWTAAPAPALPSGLTAGVLTQVAVRGGQLVALGTSDQSGRSQSFTGVSADGGRTWRMAVPAGATTLTAVTATAKGFVLAGVTGAPSRQDVVLWTSPDGAAWQPTPARGTGLDGPGDQRLAGLVAHGSELVAVGVTADHRGESPTLWRTAAP